MLPTNETAWPVQSRRKSCETRRGVVSIRSTPTARRLPTLTAAARGDFDHAIGRHGGRSGQNSQAWSGCAGDTRSVHDLGPEQWIGTHVTPTGDPEAVHVRPWATVVRVPVASG